MNIPQDYGGNLRFSFSFLWYISSGFAQETLTGLGYLLEVPVDTWQLLVSSNVCREELSLVKKIRKILRPGRHFEKIHVDTKWAWPLIINYVKYLLILNNYNKIINNFLINAPSPSHKPSHPIVTFHIFSSIFSNAKNRD